MPYDELLATRFYREWVQPQGMVDSVHTMLDKTATTGAAFVVFRHERDGLVDDETRRRMRLIVPHIRRAVLVARLIDLKQAQAATFADTLDGLSAGLFLVDASGRIVHANAAAHGILAEDDFLRTISGRLVARDAHIDQHLRIFAAASGDIEIGISIAAVDGHDGERHAGPRCHGVGPIAAPAWLTPQPLPCSSKAAMETPSRPKSSPASKLTPHRAAGAAGIV